MMVCEHLRDLEQAIVLAGIEEKYHGQVWSKNCRKWVYFDCVLDASAVGKTFELATSVSQQMNDDPKSS